MMSIKVDPNGRLARWPLLIQQYDFKELNMTSLMVTKQVDKNQTLMHFLADVMPRPQLSVLNNCL